VPEQEKTRSKQESEVQELSPAREQIGQAIAEGGGAQAINPMIIIPPVLITAVMALLLAMVYGVTKEPIAEAKRLDKQQKLAAVMPTFANDPLELEQVLSDSVTLYTGTVEGGVNGYGITSSVKTGYSGYFSIVFGMAPDGTIERVRILESFETPGLGSKAGESPFIDQFDGKQGDSFDFRVVKDGGQIDAITGATITSRAVCDALTAGLDAFGQADLSAFEPRDIEQEIEEYRSSMAEEASSEEEAANESDTGELEEVQDGGN
jgi:electron transport complex protein RnfG